jgi:hypothetical protein
MVLSPIHQGRLVTILRVFHCITVGCIQIKFSTNCPNNPTQWHHQMFLPHFLLLFINHSLAKLRSFLSDLIKKFLTAIKLLPIAMPCMLSTKTYFKPLTTNKMATEKFLYANLPIHHSHQQRYHKSNHNQTPMTQPPV